MTDVFDSIADRLSLEDIDKLRSSCQSLQKETAAWLTDQEAGNKHAGGILRLDIAATIVKRNFSKSAVYLKVMGIPDRTFLLISKIMVLQNHNLIFRFENIILDLKGLFFYLDESVLVSDVFLGQSLLQRSGHMTIGCQYDPLYNVDASEVMMDHTCYNKDLRKVSGRSVRYLKALIIKKTRAHSNKQNHSSLILKAVDTQNLIDTVKIIVSFHNEMATDASDIFQEFTTVEFDELLIQNIDHKMKINFNFNLTPHSAKRLRYDVGPHELRQTFPVKISDRIRANPLQAKIIVNELSNFHAYHLHRGIACLLIKVLQVETLIIECFCGGCSKKSAECRCETKQHQFAVKLFFRAASSNIALKGFIKDWAACRELLEISNDDLDQITPYFDTKSMVSLQGFKLTKEMDKETANLANRTSHKMLGTKLAYGRFGIPFSYFKQSNSSKGENLPLFLNGCPTRFSVPGVSPEVSQFEFFFKVKHVEPDKKLTIQTRRALLQGAFVGIKG
jgi:hypothetical protein